MHINLTWHLMKKGFDRYTPSWLHTHPPPPRHFNHPCNEKQKKARWKKNVTLCKWQQTHELIFALETLRAHFLGGPQLPCAGPCACTGLCATVTSSKALGSRRVELSALLRFPRDPFGRLCPCLMWAGSCAGSKDCSCESKTSVMCRICCWCGGS